MDKQKTVAEVIAEVNRRIAEAGIKGATAMPGDTPTSVWIGVEAREDGSDTPQADIDKMSQIMKDVGDWAGVTTGTVGTFTGEFNLRTDGGTQNIFEVLTPEQRREMFLGRANDALKREGIPATIRLATPDEDGHISEANRPFKDDPDFLHTKLDFDGYDGENPAPAYMHKAAKDAVRKVATEMGGAPLSRDGSIPLAALKAILAQALGDHLAQHQADAERLNNALRDAGFTPAQALAKADASGVTLGTDLESGALSDDQLRQIAEIGNKVMAEGYDTDEDEVQAGLKVNAVNRDLREAGFNTDTQVVASVTHDPFVGVAWGCRKVDPGFSPTPEQSEQINAICARYMDESELQIRPHEGGKVYDKDGKPAVNQTPDQNATNSAD
jgi:hypothetical protein